MARYYTGLDNITLVYLNDLEGTVLEWTPEREELLDYYADELAKTVDRVSVSLHDACAVFGEEEELREELVEYQQNKIKETNQQLADLLESDRQIEMEKPRLEKDWYLDGNEETRQELLRRKAEFELALVLLGGGSRKKKRARDLQAAIVRAKQFPIEQLVTFTKKKAKCVWHNDNDPSMHYYPKNNTVWCFSCGRGGDAIDVYRAMKENCSLKEAVDYLTGQ